MSRMLAIPAVYVCGYIEEVVKDKKGDVFCWIHCVGNVLPTFFLINPCASFACAFHKVLGNSKKQPFHGTGLCLSLLAKADQPRTSKNPLLSLFSVHTPRLLLLLHLLVYFRNRGLANLSLEIKALRCSRSAHRRTKNWEDHIAISNLCLHLLWTLLLLLPNPLGQLPLLLLFASPVTSFFSLWSSKSASILQDTFKRSYSYPPTISIFLHHIGLQKRPRTGLNRYESLTTYSHRWVVDI